MTNGPRMTMNLMPRTATEVSYHIGNVRWMRQRSANTRYPSMLAECAICGATCGERSAVQHSIRKHPLEAWGVLPGQLGIPGSGVGDIPG